MSSRFGEIRPANPGGKVARIWSARATLDGAAAYERHFKMVVVPHLNTLAGHEGAYLLRRDVSGGVEIMTVTLWENHRAIRAFTGPFSQKAVVEPFAQAILSDFDDLVVHYQILHDGHP